MGIPVGKAVLTVFKYLLRPVNQQLIRRFKATHAGEKTSKGRKVFEWFGQMGHKFEVIMLRLII